MAYTAYTFLSPTSGAVNTKGAYVQVVASTPYASSRLYLTVEFGTVATRFFLLDIATGAASAETVVVANIAFQVDSDQLAGAFVPLDVDIPAGSRVSVRVQSPTASSQCTLHVLLENRAVASLANPVTYGANTVTSVGTQIDPGGTANTKGAYVPLSASTSSRMDVLLLCLTSNTGSVSAGLRWFLDVATGGAGAETIVIPDIGVAANTIADSVRPGLLRLPVSIPAGTRVAVRAACSVNTATQRVIVVTLIGMQEPAVSSGGGAQAVAYVG